VESSSRFATYVAFGLFCFAILVAKIRYAFFMGAIFYLAFALETVDIFLDYFLIIHVDSTHFLLADVFLPLNQQVDFPVGRSSIRVRSRTRHSMFLGIFLFQVAAQ
jgi:hypothetical protein